MDGQWPRYAPWIQLTTETRRNRARPGIRSVHESESGSGKVERDERQQEEADNAAASLEAPGGTRLAPRLVVATAGRRKSDQLEGAVIGNRGECLGRQGAGRAEMAQRRSPAVAVETPSGANFVLSPHDFDYFVPESGRHLRYSACKRSISSTWYWFGGME